MESINVTPDKNVESAQQYALEFVRHFIIDKSNYKEEVSSILNSNQALKNGFQKYDGTPNYESLSELTIRPWGDGNLESRSIESIGDLVRGNTQKYPNIEVLRKIREEWVKRTNEIKEDLKNFQGDEKDAFNLIQKIHQDKILNPLNSDSEPVMISK